MATIVTRSGKGSPLTNAEVDANFTNLNTDKLESGDLSVTTTAVGTAALAYSSGVFTYTPPDLSAIDLSLYAPLAGAVFTGTVEAPLFEGDLSGAQLFPAKAGEALTKGDALYISGISGNKPVVMKADANNPAKMPSFGLAGATVNNNESVNCVTYGQIHNVDTTAFSLGDQLYVSTTAGALTSTAPTGETSQIQNLGKVERVHASAGALFVAGSGRANATPNLDNGNFFLGNASNQSVSADFSDSVVAALSGGSGISLSAAGVIANTAPDQTVALTGAGATSISGTYPNFTISSVNTTYSVGDGGLSEINFTSADHTKLNGIATGATNVTNNNQLTNGAGYVTTNTTYSAGSGISLSGTTFSLTDTNAKLNLSGGTLTGNIAINKTSPEITLHDTNSSTGSSPKINFTTANNQGVSLYHNEFDNELPVAGYGLVLDAASGNLQYPTTGTLSFVVKGEIYTGSTTLSATNKVWHEGTLTTTNKSNYDTAYGWGNHASAGYYAASNPNGYTNDQTASEILTAIKTVDGSGSGLDADLLDGQQGSYYAANSSLNSYMPIRMSTPYAVIPTGGWAGYNLGNGTMLQSSSVGLPSGGTHGYWHVTGRRDSGGGYVGLYFQNYSASSGMWIGKSLTSADPTWERVWSAGTDGSGSGLDADLLDGLHATSFASSTFNVASGASSSDPNSRTDAYFLTNSANAAFGSLFSHIQNHWWSSVGGNVAQHATTYNGSTARFAVRHRYSGSWTSWAQAWTQVNDGSGSGLDADLLDGQQGSSFLRSNAADTFTGTLTMGTQLALVANNYGRGVFGLYSATRYQHVWSMGTAYKTNDSGTSYGNMYGLTYTHTNVGTGTNQAISGLSHQLQHRTNGTLTAAIGSGIWTSGNVTAYSDIAVKTNLVKIPDALEKVCSINGYTYERTDYVKDLEDPEAPDVLRQAGVVAQEVEKILPEVVSGKDGNKAVAYGNMVALMIEAIKELKAEVDDLKTQLENK